MADLPDHWQYAFGSAARALQSWAHTFSFRDEVFDHAFVGSDPSRLVSLIDAFLADDSTNCLGGTRWQLEQLRPFVADRILPVYQRGLAAGADYFFTFGHECGAVEQEDLHAAAWARAEDQADLKDWFVEGFCVGYTSKESDSRKEDLA